ncbi:MAG: hypothetical protein C4320_06165, partial [Armatimonadota bacterium]
MTLGVSMWSYVHAWRAGNFGIADFIRAAQETGVESVELLDFFYRNPQDPWSDSATPALIAAGRSEAHAALRETGLKVAVFSVANDFAKADPAEREGELAKIAFGIAEAQEYEANIVRVFAGDVKPGVSFHEARSWIVEGLTAASRLAEGAGIRLALENHGSLAGQADQVYALIQDVRAGSGTDALGANPDTGNFLVVDADPVASVRKLAPLATMVHFKDFARVGQEEESYRSVSGQGLAGRAVGEGDVDLAGCVAALRAGG